MNEANSGCPIVGHFNARVVPNGRDHLLLKNAKAAKHPRPIRPTGWHTIHNSIADLQ